MISQSTPSPTGPAVPENQGWLDSFAIRRGAGALHRQIHDLVRAEITSGRLAPGAQLPPEGELAARWNVSLAPVRQALLDLQAAGYLDRGQGRGTFVRQPKIEEKLSILSSFSRNHQRDGDISELRVLFFGETDSAPSPATAVAADRWVLLHRVAFQSSTPAALLRAYMDPDRFPDISSIEMRGESLYRVMTTRYGVHLSHAETTMEAVQADEEQASILQLRRGESVFRVDSVTYDQDSSPVEFTRVLYPLDRFRFTLSSLHYDDRVIHFPRGRANGTEGPFRDGDHS